MKTNLKFTLPMLALAATTTLLSCSDNDMEIDEFAAPDPSKALIEFTSHDGNIAHRAALATRAGNLISFGGDTKIAMRIKSEGKTSGDVRYTVTEMKAEQASCSGAMHLIAAGKDASNNANAHDHVSYVDAASYRYWDDAFGRDAKLSIYAIAVPGKTDITLKSVLKGIKTDDSDTFNKGEKVSNENPNWFTESAEDETFAWEVGSTDGQTTSTIEAQDICYSNNIRERNPIEGGDQDDADKGVYRFTYSNTDWIFQNMVAGRLQWTPKATQNANETVGKFDQGHLIFKHALSKVTIKLKEAEDKDGKTYGFNNSSNADFKFTVTNKNVELIDFPVKNTFNLKDGSWSKNNSDITSKNIASLQEITENSTANITERKVTGLVIPGKTLAGVTTNALHFVIDDNDYYVTCDQIAKAIQDYYKEGGAGASDPRANELKNFTTMKQGEHYEINITVAKTKIENITAQLVDWETVTSAPIEPSNAYVTFQLESKTEGGITDKNTFNLYRAPENADLNPEITGNDTYYNGITKFGWQTGYITATTDDAASSNEDHAKDKATKKYEDSKWKTEWFWPDNKTYYHFRTVGNTEGKEANPSDVIIYKHATNGDYYKITSGKIEDSNYKDYTWGAPFNKKTSDSKFFYSTAKGFDAIAKDDASADGATPSQDKHQIYKAIGAADPKTQNINLIMFHMTSQITVNVTTTDDESRVILGNQENDTKVELLHFYKNGVVRVGNGLVEPDETTVTDNDEFKWYTSEYVAYDGTTNPKTTEKSVFKYGVVPQPLKFTNNSKDYTIGIRITTKDGNQYVINDISEVYATVTSENLNIPYTAGTETNAGKYLIDRWYPGYKYTYTVKIKKTGIESITAQLVDWETVNGDLGIITLEKVTE